MKVGIRFDPSRHGSGWGSVILSADKRLNQKRGGFLLNQNMPAVFGHMTIGMKAPDFFANTTFGNLRFSDYAGRWVIFFSHPGDFTPVCTTEMIAFAQMIEGFTERNCQLLGLSIDSNTSHLAWVRSIRDSMGVMLPFPIVADRTGEISRMYGMIAPDASESATVRNVFVIDPEQVIRAILVYPMETGRNTYEILRLLEALQTADREKAVTPANWLPDNPLLLPPPKTVAEMEKRDAMMEAGEMDCRDWYACEKQMSLGE